MRVKQDSRLLKKRAHTHLRGPLAALLSVGLLLSIWRTPDAQGAIKAGTSAVGLLTMQQALNDGLLCAPRAAAARAKLGISRAGYAQALTFPNPYFEADYSKAEQTYRNGIGSSIEPPWKLAFRLLAAKMDVGKASAEIGQSLWSLRAEIRRLYTDFAIAGEMEEMTRELAELTRTLFEAARLRFETGEAPKLDVYRAQLASAQAQIDAEQAQRKLIQSREQLNIIIGHDEQTPLRAPRLTTFQLYAAKDDLLPDLNRELQPLSCFEEEALRTRFEIKVVQASLRAEKAHLLEAIGNIVPNPQISSGLSHVTDPPKRGPYLTMQIPIPLGNFQQGEIALRRANIRQLKFELQAQENIVRSQVALAYRKVWNAREKVRSYEQNVLAQSQKVAELGRVSYRLGQTDITSALTAQQSNIQVRQQFLNTISEYQQAFTDLEQAVGHPLE